VSILVNQNTRLLVQGFTGSQATLHSEQSIDYGTNIVGGVTPGKGGQTHLGAPVFNSVHDAMKAVKPNASIIFVPAPFCKDSILEAADAGIKLIICITECWLSSVVHRYHCHMTRIRIGPDAFKPLLLLKAIVVKRNFRHWER
jgi:succinyl-CoA synthetase alpha subunit